MQSHQQVLSGIVGSAENNFFYILNKQKYKVVGLNLRYQILAWSHPLYY